MKAIKKSEEPTSLIEYRLTNDAVYDGPNFTPVKDKIRDSLLIEQGYLCAYCMKRISSENMKVEHWQCQSDFEALQLDYKNMLGCCNGNEGNPKRLQTCDTRKGSLTLSFSPANPLHRIEFKVLYTDLGFIFSNDKKFNAELNETLNLNQSRLKSNREAALKALTSEMSSRPGRRTKADLDKLLVRYETPENDGKMKEYSGLMTYYLRKKISKC